MSACKGKPGQLPLPAGNPALRHPWSCFTCSGKCRGRVLELLCRQRYGTVCLRSQRQSFCYCMERSGRTFGRGIPGNFRRRIPSAFPVSLRPRSPRGRDYCPRKAPEAVLYLKCRDGRASGLGPANRHKRARERIRNGHLRGDSSGIVQLRTREICRRLEHAHPAPGS